MRPSTAQHAGRPVMLPPVGTATRAIAAAARAYSIASRRPPAADLLTTTPSTMDKNRIEAFSDGVIAVIITIIVLEMKASAAF